MPAADPPPADLPTTATPTLTTPYTELPFPPLTKQHVLNCSVHTWYPKYRAFSPKARLIPLSPAFVHYLKADGIVLPPSPSSTPSKRIEWTDGALGEDSDTDSNSEQGEEEEEEDVSASWPETHAAIRHVIKELGGKVAPKLNWSAPKDATWINATNSMACTSAEDVYLMLKSSDFVAHDLGLWGEGYVEEEGRDGEGREDQDVEGRDVPYHLLLRKWVQIAPSVEFRCFVRRRRLLGICQRDPNHYDFLFEMVPQLRSLISDFFEDKLEKTFPDGDFVFDVYVPSPYRKVWLVDFNPWAGRTDPLLFSWLELLTMEGPEASHPDGFGHGQDGESRRGSSPEEIVRIPIRPSANTNGHQVHFLEDAKQGAEMPELLDDFEGDEDVFVPEFRLIKKDDPEAYSFNSPQYSAHKLPADVVEASQSGPGPLREFAEQWKEMLAQERERNGAGAGAAGT